MSTRPANAARRPLARARREQARERIVAAAERLLRGRPYRELSVEDVMTEAGLSRTVFYRHFDGLPELVLSLLEAIRQALMGELVADVPVDHLARTQAILAAAVDAFAEHGSLMRAIDQAASHDAQIEAAFRSVTDEFTGVMAAQLEVSMAEGRVAPGNAYELARALNLMNQRYLLETVARDPSFDRRLALDTLMAVWRPVSSHT